MEIRAFEPSDQRAFEAFFAGCMAGIGWEYQPNGRHADVLDVAGAYLSKGRVYLAEEGGKIVGSVAVYTFRDAPKSAEIKRLYVLREHQGKGYGEALLLRALRWARESGHEFALLDSRSERAAALGLFRKHGFREIPKYNDNHYANRFFRLPLTPEGGEARGKE